MEARDAAAALERMAVPLELKGENSFKISACRQAAQALPQVTEPLADLAKKNRLVPLKGFGAKTQTNVLKGIAFLKKNRRQHLWAEVEPVALDLVQAIGRCPDVRRVQVAGSFRRFKELVKDLDLVLETDHPQRVAEYLKGLDLVEGLHQNGPAHIAVQLKNGLGVDLRLVDSESFPFALLHFTGSRNHNAQIRRRANGLGFQLNEFGLFDPEGRPRPARDEDRVFGLLNLPYIPPELREGLGEIEAAEHGRLPALIEEKEIKGLFHVHSSFSDGRQSIADIAARCQTLGFEYVGLADHSRSAAYAGGLTIEDLNRQIEEVARVREQFPEVGLFWGIESDIRADGSLDYPDEVLARFDFVIASIHSHFQMSEKEMTRRLVKAVANPFTFILGHPSGRLLLDREPYRVNLEAVLEAAAKTGTVVEINANPQRLDLDWRHLRRARELGLKMAISPDAHDQEGLSNVRYGVYTARKGWLTAGHVINCLGRSDIQRLLASRKKDAPCFQAAGGTGP